MNNVIAFPRPSEKSRVATRQLRSMTLFLHIKCSTLIVHLADNRVIAERSERVGKS